MDLDVHRDANWTKIIGLCRMLDVTFFSFFFTFPDLLERLFSFLLFRARLVGWVYARKVFWTDWY